MNQVLTNGIPAGSNIYWTNGQVIKLLVGSSVTNAVIKYTLLPNVQGGFYTVQEGAPLSVVAPGVLTNASLGAEGGSLTALLVGKPANGGLTLNGDGSFTYTPSNSFVGIDSFTCQATSGSLTSGVATVIIDVTPSGDLFYDDFTRPSGSSNSMTPWIVEAGSWTLTNGSDAGNMRCLARTLMVAPILKIPIGRIMWLKRKFSFPQPALGRGDWADDWIQQAGARYMAWVYPDGSGGGANTIQLLKFSSWLDEFSHWDR